jgi:predicted exporter
MEDLRRDRVIGGYELISLYLPSRRLQHERQHFLPERTELQRNLDTAVKGLPFTPGLFRPFIDAVEGARSQSPVDRNALAGTRFGTRVESLLFHYQEHWTAVVPLRAVEDRERLKQIVTDWKAPGVGYVDLKEESNRLLTDYRDRTFSVVLWGSLAIAVILTIALKSYQLVWPVVLPIMCALVVMVAVVNASGESLSLFHVATFLLVIGLGLDYALFFNRPEGSAEERTHTQYGLLVCATTTILVFGLLAASTIPVLHAIGLTASLGSFCCLLFTGIMAKDRMHATG